MELNHTVIALGIPITAFLCFFYCFFISRSIKRTTARRKKSASAVLKKGIKNVQKRQTTNKNPADTYKPDIIPKGYKLAPNGDLIRNK
jgi:hypothetical protein